MTSFSSRKLSYLILALHDHYMGQLPLAKVMAKSVMEQGHFAVLATNGINKNFNRDFPCSVETLSNRMGEQMETALWEIIRLHRVNVIILCDYLGNCNLFHRMGLPGLNLPMDIPKIEVDLWDSERNGASVGCLFEDEGGTAMDIESTPSPQDHVLSMTPVPIAPFSGKSQRFNAMPGIPNLFLTRGMGENGKKKILTTSSPWQHHASISLENELFQLKLPELMAGYLEHLGPKVEWIHVGPEPFELNGKMAGQYHWLPSLSPLELDDLLGNIDLFLSFNACGNIMIRAALMGTPTVLIQNSHRWTMESFSPLPWIRGSELAYPFRLWPLQYYQFLDPLFQSDSFYSIVHTVEALDQEDFLQTCSKLLYDSDYKTVDAEMKIAFRIQLNNLPDAATAIQDFALNHIG